MTEPTQPTPPTRRPSVQPERSLQDRWRAFPATYSLVAVSLAVFLLQVASQLSFGDDLVIALGAKVNKAVVGGEIWRLVTPIFIHVNALHIFINMYSLNAIGPVVERLFQAPRMLVLYVLSGVAGVAFSLGFSRSASVGASGAIFGLLGALGAFLFIHRKTLGAWAVVRLRRIALVALVNLGIGLMPGIDNWGHVGGLIAGAALAGFLGPRFHPTLVETLEVRMVDGYPWSRAWPRALVAAAVIGLVILGAVFSPINR